MTFPYMISFGSFSVHPHLLFETLSYFIGFRLYLWLRRQDKDSLPLDKGIWVVAGAILGAALGSKILAWLADPIQFFDNLGSISYLMSGKTIVGGLLGGLIGVELAKKWVGHSRSTGDSFVYPLITGMAIGRIGCFLTGLADNTHGIATSLPWGVDFGDGIPRHPAQLYEIAFLIGLAAVIYMRKRFAYEQGDLFKLFMVGYLAFRFLVDFIKPYPGFYLGLTQIQLACLAGIFYYRKSLLRLFTFSQRRELNA
jgi:prolipoprotein diacylglyceryltransferase